jgi:drug/metabolite transporter (DMT)-like permease
LRVAQAASAACGSGGEPVRRRQFGGAALIVVGAILYFSGDLGATWIGMLASVGSVSSPTRRAR